MNGRVANVGTGLVGIAGLALLGVEGVEAMRNVVLTTLSTGLLFGGLGLVVLAGALAAAGVLTAPGSSLPATQPAVAAPTEPVVEQPRTPARKRAAAPVGTDLVDREAGKAARWTLVHRADCAGRVKAGELTASVRRGATLIAYREGLEVSVGAVSQHRSWRHVTKVVADLAGTQATVTVDFTTNVGAAQATFSGKTGDLAPIATALVSAAPSGIVEVTYG
jgi:hypothetical protein